jgi:hypothetical protein
VSTQLQLNNNNNNNNKPVNHSVGHHLVFGSYEGLRRGILEEYFDLVTN